MIFFFNYIADVKNVSDSNKKKNTVGIEINTKDFLDSLNIILNLNFVLLLLDFGIGFYMPGYSCDFNKETSNLRNDFDLPYNSSMYTSIGVLGKHIPDKKCMQFIYLNLSFTQKYGLVFRGNLEQIIFDDVNTIENKNSILVNFGINTDKIPKMIVKNSKFHGRFHVRDSNLQNEKIPCQLTGIITPVFSKDEFPENYDFEDIQNQIQRPIHSKTVNGELRLKNNKFYNFFKGNDCNDDSYAIYGNNYQQSSPIQIIFENQNQFFNIDKKNRIFFLLFENETNSTTYCSQNRCDGNANTFIIDQFGSILGDKVPKNYIQKDNKMFDLQSLFYNKDLDFYQVHLEKTLLIKLGKNAGTTQTIGIDKSQEGETRSRIEYFIKKNDYFTGQVHLFEKNFIMFEKILSSTTQFKLENAEENDYVILQIKIASNKSVNVFQNDTKTNRIILFQSTESITDQIKCGRNSIDFDTNTISFILTGDSSCNLKIKFFNAVATSIILNYQNQFQNMNMADKSFMQTHFDFDQIRDFIKTVQNDFEKPQILENLNIREITFFQGNYFVLIEIYTDDSLLFTNKTIESLEKTYCEFLQEITNLVHRYNDEIVIDSKNVGIPFLLIGENPGPVDFGKCKSNPFDSRSCLVFKDNSNKCESCRNGYFLNSDLSLCQAENCKQIDFTTGECSACDDEFWMDKRSFNVCKKYSNMNNCQSLNKERDSCLSCVNDYFLEFNFCREYVVDDCKEFKKNPNCIECGQLKVQGIENQCSQCPVSSKELIIKCMNQQECLEYDSCLSVCTKCSTNHFLSQQNKCVSKKNQIPNCVSYDENETCTECRFFHKFYNLRCEINRKALILLIMFSLFFVIVGLLFCLVTFKYKLFFFAKKKIIRDFKQKKASKDRYHKL